MTETLGSKAIEIAETYLGQHEATGHNDGAFVNTVQAFVSQGDLGAPWCACFACFCIKKAADALGVETIMPKTDSSSQIWEWAKANGKVLAFPQPNCIGLVKAVSMEKTHCHTFFVKSIGNTVVYSIDGNEDNQVEYSAHLIKNCDFVEVC